MGEIDDLHFRADNILSPQETEANYFAAELLMPEILIDRCIENGMFSITELAASFQVSDQAMRYRLINIGYL